MTLKELVETYGDKNHLRQLEVLQKYATAITTTNPEKFEGQLFITGMSSRDTPDQMPDYIYVCPAFGADVSCTVSYKKVEN